MGALRPDHSQPAPTRRKVPGALRGGYPITKPLCPRYQAVWRALGRYKPDALEHLPPLQCYRRRCLDNNYGLSGLLPGRLTTGRLNATLGIVATPGPDPGNLD